MLYCFSCILENNLGTASILLIAPEIPRFCITLNFSGSGFLLFVNFYSYYKEKLRFCSTQCRASIRLILLYVESNRLNSHSLYKTDRYTISDAYDI